MAEFWESDPIVSPAVAPNRPQAGGGGNFWDNDPVVQAPKSTWETVKSAAADVAQALPTGILKGAIGLAGLPADAANFIGAHRDALVERLTGEKMPRFGSGRPLTEVLGSDSLRRKFEDATGKLYEPTTTAGRFAQTVGEFIPGAGRKIVTFAVAPGIASEAAGQATEGTQLEGPARALAAIGAGVGGAALTRSRAPSAALAPALQGVDDAALTSARNLMIEAADRGVTLTWDEAVNQVTKGASNLAPVRRVVEQSPEGAAVLNPIMAQRAGQIAAAARQTFDSVAPPPASPFSVGREAGAIAEGRVNQVRGAINDASDPFYAEASVIRLSPADMRRVRALPGYDEAARAVRADPQLARYVQGMPEDSVGFLNEVKKQLDTAAKGAASPMNPQANQQRAAGFGSDASVARQIGIDASPDYARALTIQERGRAEILQPILDGPIGKIASKDTTTKQAIDALFPADPLAGTAAEAGAAISTLASKSPRVARELVRLHAEGVFNRTAKNLQSGENQFGGAKFAAAIRGNPQQAENLEASVRALPDGAARWEGFSKFLEIAEATGKRPAANSATAQNLQIQNAMKGGGVVGEATNVVATGGLKLPGRITKWYEEMQQGKQAGALAKLLVDPNAVGVLRALAKEPTTGAKATMLAARLAAIGAQTRNQ